MNQKWVAAWGASPSIADVQPAQYAKDVTLRYVLKMGIRGSAVRLRFDNLFGAEPAQLTRVTVCAAGANETTPVSFGGEAIGTIPAGGSLISDELAMDVTSGMDLVVNLYLGQFTHMINGVGCSGPLSGGHFAMGDLTDHTSFSLLEGKEIGTYFFLSELDVLADEHTHALIAFGDSITSQSWPDHLTLRMLESGRENLSVIRRGISGSRVLREYSHLQHRHYGPGGMARFEREVNIPGADRVLILHGINDIIHPDGVHPARPMEHLPTPEALIDGLRAYINAAHSYGMKAYLATLTPILGWRTDAPDRQALRAAVNEWIRATDEADGLVDFAAATCDPAEPRALKADCDSGDHLHPSNEGARAMAYSIPEDYLR